MNIIKGFYLSIRRLAVLFIVLVGIIGLTGCESMQSANHAYLMQGEILSVDGSNIVACVGDKHGAKVGQELDVVRHVAVQSNAPHDSMKIRFKREMIGKVRIKSLFDEHYANAKIISGSAAVNDMVELNVEK
jgi:hypothetical protein